MSKPRDMESYEIGYRDGESNAHADWYIALSEVLPEDFDITPANVATLLARLST